MAFSGHDKWYQSGCFGDLRFHHHHWLLMEQAISFEIARPQPKEMWSELNTFKAFEVQPTSYFSHKDNLVSKYENPPLQY
jgi:hypothetical protein